MSGEEYCFTLRLIFGIFPAPFWADFSQERKNQFKHLGCFIYIIWPLTYKIGKFLKQAGGGPELCKAEAKLG